MGRIVDVPIIKDIVDRSQSRNVTFIDQEIRPEMAIGIFKRVDMVLGVRLHAVLLASSMATPVVAIAYEQKVHGLMQRLDLQDYVVDLFSLNSEDLD